VGKAAPVEHAGRLADLLEQQAVEFVASDAAKANIAKLRAGARAVVTGQQVVLFGGPLLTLLKAATAVVRAKEATKATGVEHVPVFWLATEDHDLEEVDQVSLLTKTSVETLRAGLKVAHAVPVGGVVPGPEVEAVLERASELLEFAPVSEWLRECYLAGPDGARPTLALAFGRLMARIFADQGLIVMDAASREFHALGARTLRYAIERADELQAALIARGKELVAAGYHAQVLVAEGGSMLFLLDEATGERVALRRVGNGDAQWKAGGRVYSSADLIAILEAPSVLAERAEGRCFRTRCCRRRLMGGLRDWLVFKVQRCTRRFWGGLPVCRVECHVAEPVAAGWSARWCSCRMHDYWVETLARDWARGRCRLKRSDGWRSFRCDETELGCREYLGMDESLGARRWGVQPCCAR
jgi:uncharacterized protein YllA (UPF0747 family)